MENLHGAARVVDQHYMCWTAVEKGAEGPVVVSADAHRDLSASGRAVSLPGVSDAASGSMGVRGMIAMKPKLVLRQHWLWGFAWYGSVDGVYVWIGPYGDIERLPVADAVKRYWLVTH